MMHPSTVDSDLAQAIAGYDALADVREQQPYYAQRIYPLLRERFRQQPDPQSGVQLLLVSISNPHVPVFAAAYWKPTAVFAIYSEYSQRFRATIEREVTSLGVDCDGAVVLNIEADPAALYQAIKRAVQPYLRSGRNNPQIALDVTGGTSVMSVGAAMAVSLVGGQLLYIPSDPRPDDPTKRQIGTERCLPFADPYTVFGDLEAAEAQRNFQQHDYAVAAQLFSDLAARVPENASYAAAAALAAAYADWEIFAFAQASAQLSTLLKQPLATLPMLAVHTELLARQQALLDRLTDISAAVVRRDGAALGTLADALAILPLLGTLHGAAIRRATQKRYDFAALFRYRCLELISQHRLASYGILCNKPDYRAAGIAPALMKERFGEVQRVVGRKDLKKLPERNIALFDGYMLLATLDDPLVRGYDLKQIEARTNARNHSVLAHGYRLIGQDEYDAFAEVVDAMIDRLFDRVLGQPRDDWELLAQFIDPFDA